MKRATVAPSSSALRRVSVVEAGPGGNARLSSATIAKPKNGSERLTMFFERSA
jgi:hypothetical protein